MTGDFAIEKKPSATHRRSLSWFVKPDLCLHPLEGEAVAEPVGDVMFGSPEDSPSSLVHATVRLEGEARCASP